MTIVELKGILEDHDKKMTIYQPYSELTKTYGIIKVSPVKSDVDSTSIHYVKRNNNQIDLRAFIIYYKNGIVVPCKSLSDFLKKMQLSLW